jgi:hypothetical protein
VVNCIESLSAGESVQQTDQASVAITPGTLMQKPIPPRLIEPYLTGRRTVIAGFVYRVQDSSFSDPAEYYETLDLGFAGSGFGPDISELYVLRWQALSLQSYRVPHPAEHDGDGSGSPPFTETGLTSSPAQVAAEFYLDPMPVPVGAEIFVITWGGEAFIARFDGQVWLRPAAGGS